jgi:hypothetical protein
MFEQYNSTEFTGTREKVVCKEGHTTITFLNKSRITIAKIHIDGGVIKSQNCLKCDYLLLCEKERLLAVFVELKGNKVMHAIDQLEATFENATIRTPLTTYKRYAYAVAARVPKFDTQIQAAKDRFRKKGW